MICDVAGWSVVHVTVTEVLVTFVVATFVITGGVDTSAAVMKVELPEVVDPAPASTETTSKSYVVPGVRPVIVTE